MAVNVAVTIRGDLAAAMRDESRILRKSVTQGLAQTGQQTRTELLRMMRRNRKLGKRLSGTKSTNLVRVLRKPRKGFGLWDPRVVVFSRATYKAGGVRGAPVDLLDVFDQGAVIRARSGKWLAIPTEHAPLKPGRGGARRATPRETKRKLTFIASGHDRAVLVDRQARAVLYVLVKQVRIRKRLNIDRVFLKNAANLTTNIERKLEAEYRRTGNRIAA